ncbi:MAG: C4-dicarboxylate transporter [Burkholderiales bacterium]|jgi:aerobic C4-dicarboxylate transport protein|nr:C4-dicarboxylate transporter [Burkholderiales bacterium]
MKKRKWFLSLWFWVLIFMLMGICFGAISPVQAKACKPLIDHFIEIIRILVGPIIFLTVISGIIGMGSLKSLGTIGLKSFIYFEAFSTIALVLGLCSAKLLDIGHDMNLSVARMDPGLVAKYIHTTHKSTEIGQILLNVIPHNPITPFITGNTLQVLFMAIVSGFILFYFGGKFRNSVGKAIKNLQHIAFKILSVVMLFSPVAAFSAMAFMIGEFGINILLQMFGLVLAMFGTCVFFILVILGIIAKLNGFSILKFLNLIKDEIILVFATSSSESALGPIMNKLTKSGVEQSVVGIVIPAGYSFNLDGTNIYLAMVIAFLCHAFNIRLSWTEYLFIIGVLMATSKGAAGVSGAGFIVLAGTLSVMHGKIPVVTIGILLGIDKVMSELRSTTNLVGNSVAAVIIAAWEKKLDLAKFNKALTTGKESE